MRVLVTRPSAQAAATARRLAGLGHEAVVAPLFDYVAVDWQPPHPGPDAVMLTSAAGVRLAGPALGALVALPCFAVGGSTAAAAREAGFAVVGTDTADARALMAAVAASGYRRILHIAGRDIVDVPVPPGIEVVRRIAYAAEARAWTDAERAAAIATDLALAYSRRGGTALANALSPAERGGIALAALSPAIASAAGGGWARVGIAAAPDEDALFAAAGLLCQ